MASGNGTPPPGSAEKSLGEIVNDVTEKATLLVREEIELAKAEMQQKVTRIAKGAVFAAVAGAFALFMLIYLLEGLAWLVNDLLNVTSGIWIGFLVVTAGLLILGAICALLAVRFFKKGTPPMPELAIEEAKKTREALAEEVQR
jgi:uncharacterized membrane protein YqjE